MNKTLADLLKTESKHVNDGFCYSTYPYPCHITEALVYAKNYTIPNNPTITRSDNEVIISLKPRKGSRKRKPMIIKLWY